MRPEKISIINEIRGQLEETGYVILSDYRGLKMADMTELRAKLAEVSSEVHVVRNTLLGCAAGELGWDGAATLLDGPTAMVVGKGDVTEVAKVLRDFVKAHQLPVVKGGWLDAKVVSSQDVLAMADLPTRTVMLGRFVATVAAPMTQLVGVMQQKVLSLLYVLKAVEEKRLSGE